MVYKRDYTTIISLPLGVIPSAYDGLPPSPPPVQLD